MTVGESESCPYHLDLQLQQGLLSVNKLSIKLNGGLVWLYDAVLGPLSEALGKVLSTTLMSSLMDAVLDAGNKALHGFGTAAADGFGSPYRTDQRWAAVAVTGGLLQVGSPGQLLVRHNDSEK